MPEPDVQVALHERASPSSRRPASGPRIPERVPRSGLDPRLELHGEDRITVGAERHRRGDPAMFVSRSLKADDPLTPISTDILTVLRFGRPTRRRPVTTK